MADPHAAVAGAGELESTQSGILVGTERVAGIGTRYAFGGVTGRHARAACWREQHLYYRFESGPRETLSSEFESHPLYPGDMRLWGQSHRRDVFSADHLDENSGIRRDDDAPVPPLYIHTGQALSSAKEGAKGETPPAGSGPV